jgi:hypothetical protein
MIMEALSWYLESLTAFWVSFAGGGLLRLILILCLISLICRRRTGRRCHHNGCRCRCSHCGCRCGHCPCGAKGHGKAEGAGKDEAGGEAEEAV